MIFQIETPTSVGLWRCNYDETHSHFPTDVLYREASLGKPVLLLPDNKTSAGPNRILIGDRIER